MLRRPPGSTRTDTPFPYTTLFRSLDLGGRSEGAHRDASARTLDIAHHLAEVAARLDIYCVILPEPLDRKGMLIRAERACGGREGRKLGRLGHAFGIGRQPRSEEHTSEIQSLMRISYAVFCLKKKKHK